MGLVYAGDCRTILDEHEEWENLDASQMSCLVESGLEITKERFFELVEKHSQPFASGTYWYSKEHHVAWIHNKDEDIHYFYN